MEITKKIAVMIYEFNCKGRDAKGRETLTDAVVPRVGLSFHPNSDMISSHVACPYVTDVYEQRCKASHSNVDKIKGRILCPYNFDLNFPYGGGSKEAKELCIDYVNSMKVKKFEE